MIIKLQKFVRNNLLLVLLTVATLIVIGWFGFRFIADFIYFHDPNNVDVELKGWMTARFIVLTYDLPRPFVFDLLGIQSHEEGGAHLKFIAEELGVSLEELTQKVRQAAAEYRDANP